MTPKKKTTKQTSPAKKSHKKRAEFVLVRSRDAGVHAGYLVRQTDTQVELRDSRRIWSWSGAATLSELAVYGAKNGSKCRFGVKLPKLSIANWCEVIACQLAGQVMIEEQPEWRA